jgi:small GTP-binding protein
LDQNGELIGIKSKLGYSDNEIKRIKTFIRQMNQGIAKSISLKTNVFEMGLLRFVFVKAGPELSFVSITKKQGPPEQTLSYSYLAAEKLWRIMDGRSVVLEIPIFDALSVIDTTDQPLTSDIRHFDIKPDQYLAKLTIVGDEKAGKTSLVRRYISNTFSHDYKSTIGINILTKLVRFPDEETTMMLAIHDMGGQDIFASVRKAYFRGTHACFIVFDVTNRKSLENVKKWYDETMQYAGESTAIILLGNKSDLHDERVISHEDVREMIQELEITYIEVSARTGVNVESAFSLITLFLCDFREDQIKPPEVIKDFITYAHLDEMFHCILKSLKKPFDQYNVISILIKGHIGVNHFINKLQTLLDPQCDPILILGPTTPMQVANTEEATIGWVSHTRITEPLEANVEILSPENPAMINVFLNRAVESVAESRNPVILGDFLDNIIPFMDRRQFHRFIGDIAATARISNHTKILLVKADIHTEQENNIVKHFSDVVIETREREVNGTFIREVRVSNTEDDIQTDWIGC